MCTELALISSELPLSVWLFLWGSFRVMNYPGSGNFSRDLYARDPINIKNNVSKLLAYVIVASFEVIELF